MPAIGYLGVTLDFDVGSLLTRVDTEAHHRNTLVAIGIDIERVQRRGSRPGIDLGLYLADFQARECHPLPPADLQQLMVIKRPNNAIPGDKMLEKFILGV